MIIQVHKTWCVFEIESRMEFPCILWISDKNYILQEQRNIWKLRPSTGNIIKQLYIEFWKGKRNLYQTIHWLTSLNPKFPNHSNGACYLQKVEEIETYPIFTLQQYRFICTWLQLRSNFFLCVALLSELGYGIRNNKQNSVWAQRHVGVLWNYDCVENTNSWCKCK